ncbi:hypothetical protein CH75_06235 [Dyella jiangningensis]|nr:hypothetical protein CH75_06235 [Dyella jiangningensis]
MTTDQLRECPFCGECNSYVERYDFSSCYVTCNKCMSRGPVMVIEDEDEEVPGHDPALLAWNTRPTAVASHAEGEVVAWMVTRDRDPTFPRTYSEKELAVACAASVTLPPFAKIVDLYTHPPRSGDEADAARYRWLRDRGWFTNNYGEFEASDDETAEHVSVMLDQAIDAAMAARGGEKAA